jgi:hypothetical protein
MKKVSTTSPEQPPGEWRITKFMLSSTLLTEANPSKVNVPHASIMVDAATSKPTPAMMIALIPSVRKSGRLLAML